MLLFQYLRSLCGTTSAWMNGFIHSDRFSSLLAANNETFINKEQNEKNYFEAQYN